MSAALSEIERKYVLRAEISAHGYLMPEGKRQTQVCERLADKGVFVRLEGGGYTTPEIADALGLDVRRHDENQ